jgi:hypothetical protein
MLGNYCRFFSRQRLSANARSVGLSTQSNLFFIPDKTSSESQPDFGAEAPPSPESSQLAKDIWKSSIRGIRVADTWSGYSKQVVSNLPYLRPRDVSVIMHAFARIKYKDDKLLTSLIPTIVKHVCEFSVRELVSILSAFRKLEFNNPTCIDLISNQLVILSSQWTVIDLPLIANSVSYFGNFDEKLLKKIENKTLKMAHDLSPLGIALLVSSLARLDLRNERMLGVLARALVNPREGDSSSTAMKQESFAIIINGFAKLDWNPRGLFEYIESELCQILEMTSDGARFFDNQSIVLILHAFFAYRYRCIEQPLSDKNIFIFNQLVHRLCLAIDNGEWKPSIDQIDKLSAVVSVLGDPQGTCEDSLHALKKIIRTSRRANGRWRGMKTTKIGTPKLPRWEYEVLRILRDKMGVKVKRRTNDFGRVDIVFRSRESTNPLVIVNCLGPYQYYTNSTKRTAASYLNRFLISRKENACMFMEIPFYIWNELKTDQDKIMYLMSLGRSIANEGEDVTEELTS